MNDQKLQRRVEAELEWDPSVDATRLGVAADKGVITLSGVVATYSEKLNAERAAMRVKGVRGLAEEITVRPLGDIGTHDDEIAKRAVNSLEWDVMVPHDDIQMRVENGRVTLSGEVDWDFQRDAAERSVRHQRGVVTLLNEITLKPRIQPKDITHRIHDALERQGRIDATAIRVSVEGGRVSLEGKVDSWRDRALIERAAWSAPGVNAVADHTTVSA